MLTKKKLLARILKLKAEMYEQIGGSEDDCIFYFGRTPKVDLRSGVMGRLKALEEYLGLEYHPKKETKKVKAGFYKKAKK